MQPLATTERGLILLERANAQTDLFGVWVLETSEQLSKLSLLYCVQFMTNGRSTWFIRGL